MQAFELAELVAQRAARGEPYLGFLRVPALHVGLYVLPAGGADGQAPHAEDEVYYVVRGAGTIRVGAEERPVRAGSVVYVAAGVEHRFHRITEELTVLVFFSTAPAANQEGTSAEPTGVAARA